MFNKNDSQTCTCIYINCYQRTKTKILKIYQIDNCHGKLINLESIIFSAKKKGKNKKKPKKKNPEFLGAKLS